MKKCWKYILLCLGFWAGLSVLVLCVVCWLLFTPERLTSVVNDLSDRYLHCESTFENVDLSLFSSFPYAGLKVANVALVNPVEGAPSDTLAFVSELVVGVDFKTFISSGNVVVKELSLKRSDLCLYTDSNGISNYLVFDSESDDDTSSVVLPDLIDVDKVKIENLSLSFCDVSAGIMASIEDVSLCMRGSVSDSSLNLKGYLKGDSLGMIVYDSLGVRLSAVSLSDYSIGAEFGGVLDHLDGNLSVRLPSAFVEYDSVVYVTANMLEKDVDVFSLELPFVFDWHNLGLNVAKAKMSLLSYRVDFFGDIMFPNDSAPLDLDLSFQTGTWRVGPLLAMLPHQFTSALKGMDMDADLQIEGNVVGKLDSVNLPNVEANVMLSNGRYYAPALLPYKMGPLNADVGFCVNDSGLSNVVINRMDVSVADSKLKLKGAVDDLLGTMLAKVNVSGFVSLPLLQYWVPDTLPLQLEGGARVSVDMNASVRDVFNGCFTGMNVEGVFDMSDLNVVFDTLHAQSPGLCLTLQMPSEMNQNDVDALFSARLKSDFLKCYSVSSSLSADLIAPDFTLAVNDIFDSTKQFSMCCDLGFLKTEASVDSLTVSTGPCSVVASVAFDSLRDNMLSRLSPKATVSMKGLRSYVPQLKETLRMSNLVFRYDSDSCVIDRADLAMGNSDYHFNGTVVNLESWLSREDMLRGDLYFTSNFANVDQMIDMISGLGTDKDSLSVMLADDQVEDVECPFMVPLDVDFTLHTHINTTYAFGNRISDVNGDIRICDGVAVLDEVGFVCDAARMQLTAIYKSPRPNHLFLGADFHLLDIDINNLVHLVPYIDTLVPMLSVFEGNGDFHLAAEMYMDHTYRPKQSTMRGAAAISGYDLVVMDNDVAKNIAQLLRLQDWRDKDGKLRIDSLDVEATLFRNEIELYPFRLDLHDYGLVLSGRHTVDNKCNYHVELVKSPLPVRLAVDVKGDLASPKVLLGEVRYAEFYKPAKQNAAQQQTLLIKSMIKQSLEDNVK